VAPLNVFALQVRVHVALELGVQRGARLQSWQWTLVD
jgi:hypothetical protein